MKFPLPATDLNDDIAILGRKGGGKTGTARLIVEHKLDMGSRVLIFDVLGIWGPGLRSSATGKSAGYPITIFGGPYGDLPLDPAAAVPMAQVLGRENLPAVIDMSEMLKNAQQSFLLKFFHELRRINKDALTLVLEEADLFAPQVPLSDDSKQLHSEIDWITRRGRFKGFRLISVTQRPARLSKDVLTQAATLIIHRTPSPQDRDAIHEWVKANGDPVRAKEVFDTMANLSTGEAWAYSVNSGTLRRIQFPKFKTLDTSATPKEGEKRVEPKKLAEVDITAIKSALDKAKAPKAPVKAAEKPKTVSVIPIGSVTTTPDEIKRITQDAHDSGYASGQQFFLKTFNQTIDDLTKVTQAALKRFSDRLSEEFQKSHAAVAAAQKASITRPDSISEPHRNVSRHKVNTIPRLVLKNNGSQNSEMSPTARKVAGVIHGAYPASLTYRSAALRAGVSTRSSAFRQYKKEVLASGEVIEVDGRLQSAPGYGNPASPGTDPIELFVSRLPRTQGSMLRTIADSPAPLTAEEVAALAGVSQTSSGLYSGLKELVSMDLVLKLDDRTYRLSDEMIQARLGHE